MARVTFNPKKEESWNKLPVPLLSTTVTSETMDSRGNYDNPTTRSRCANQRFPYSEVTPASSTHKLMQYSYIQ